MFEGFANWMQDHGYQQNKFEKYIKSISKLMTNPSKIDARKSNATNIKNEANMEPKWRSNSIKNT